MYETSAGTHTVEWKPYHQDLAEQAIEEYKGQGVPQDVTLPDDASVPVDADTARDIRHTYSTLVLDRDIRAALNEEDVDLAEELQKEYLERTGEEWEE